MKIQITILAVFMFSLAFAQTSIKKSGTDSGGQLSQNGNITMLSTIGEIAVQESSNTNVYISEGFIGPEIDLALRIDKYDEMIGVSIYPNPTVDFVNIDFANINDVDIVLYDSKGKKILTKSTSNNKFKINMSNYIVGSYILLIKNEEQQLYKTYKIVKKQG